MAAGAVGAGLADLLTAPMWVLPTLIVKALVCLPFTSKNQRVLCGRNIAAIFISGLLSPALYGVGSTGPIAAALERGSLAASAVWSDFAAGYLAVEGAVRTARGEDWQPQPLAFSILRGEDIYEPDNQKLLFPVAS